MAIPRPPGKPADILIRGACYSAFGWAPYSLNPLIIDLDHAIPWPLPKALLLRWRYNHQPAAKPPRRKFCARGRAGLEELTMFWLAFFSMLAAIFGGVVGWA